jgi:hypothetical protein
MFDPQKNDKKGVLTLVICKHTILGMIYVHVYVYNYVIDLLISKILLY